MPSGADADRSGSQIDLVLVDYAVQHGGFSPTPRRSCFFAAGAKSCDDRRPTPGDLEPARRADRKVGVHHQGQNSYCRQVVDGRSDGIPANGLETVDS